MKESPQTGPQDPTVALHGRRKFLKRALIAAAYVTPVLLSYSSTVFAAHCTEQMCGGADHIDGSKVWSPGCSRLA